MASKFCPSCGSGDVEVAGDKVHCRGCDVTFNVTPTGARVDELNPLAKDRQRLDHIEHEVEELKKIKEPVSGPKKEDEEIDEENDGFLVTINDDRPDADKTKD